MMLVYDATYLSTSPAGIIVPVSRPATDCKLSTHALALPATGSILLDIILDDKAFGATLK